MEQSRAWATVLVVDGDEAVRELLRVTFTGAGCSVVTAKEGGEAQAFLEGDPEVAAVVADFALAGADGIAVLERARERVPGALRILIGGGDRSTLVAKAQGVAQHVMQKPFDPADLLTLLVFARG